MHLTGNIGFADDEDDDDDTDDSGLINAYEDALGDASDDDDDVPMLEAPPGRTVRP